MLFPACIASDQTGSPVEELMLEEHESEHAALGRALGALRILCGDYDRQAALCNTHRELLDALEAFEQDLHRPRARGEQHPAATSATGAPGAERRGSLAGAA